MHWLELYFVPSFCFYNTYFVFYDTYFKPSIYKFQEVKKVLLFLFLRKNKAQKKSWIFQDIPISCESWKRELENVWVCQNLMPQEKSKT